MHWADTAGIIVAGLLIIGGLVALLDPKNMVIIHATDDMTGSPADAVTELATVRTVRFYAITALSLGVALAAFMVWALKADEEYL